MGREPILNALHNAHHSIHLVMYGFTDKKILAAIVQQKKLGHPIKIILEKHPYKANDENFRALKILRRHHILYRSSLPHLKLIHQKTLLIDQKKAFILTFNLTHSTFKNERNFALLIEDPKQIQAITSLFISDWKHQLPKVQHPDLLISPINSREKLLHLIRNSKNNIKIYAQTLNDYQIISALITAAKRGVDIEILTSGQLRTNLFNDLKRAGIKFYTPSKYYIHAKVLIFDDEKAVMGSLNLTRASFDDNRELAIITRDQNVIQQLNFIFNQDRAMSHPQKEENKILTFFEKWIAHPLITRNFTQNEKV